MSDKNTMIPESQSPFFSTKKVCSVLLNKGLVSKEQVKIIAEKKGFYFDKLEKTRKLKYNGNNIKIENPVTIIDVITSMNLKMADDPSRSVDEEVIYQALSRDWGLPYKKIDPLKLDLNLVTTTIPRSFAMKHLLMPVSIDDGYLTVSTSNPFNFEAFEDVARASQMKVKTVVSTKSDIIKLIDEFFGFKSSIAAAENQFGAPGVDLGNLEQYVRLKSADELPSNDQHIVNAVNHLFTYAFDQRASDVHIEPKRDISLVRMRIDGILHTVYQLPKNVHSAVLSRVKTLSRLNMAEKRRPQDGRIKIERSGTEAEIRVSTVPVAFGEKVVMRIMQPDILFQELDCLGLSSFDLDRYYRMINRPHGMVLVCGPTGSGKTTTLYSTMRYLSSPKINITTVEDPIEMVHEEFNQIAVQSSVGITFATILRNILRQDPDIIMVGEMRDIETAQNAIQSALTGHLVLSTLHTNDSTSSITRLLDLGVPSFLIQSTLTGIVSQRLVRKICNHCKQPYKVKADQLKEMGLNGFSQNDRVTLYQGTGCQRCRHTGYHGRIGVFEVLPYSEALNQMTTMHTSPEALREKAIQEGLVSLRESAVKKLLEGVTTCEEVLRVTWEQV